MEKDICAKNQLVQFLEATHEEKITPEMLRRVGLPEDKFEAALIKMKIKYANKTPLQKFIAKFLFQGKTD